MDITPIYQSVKFLCLPRLSAEKKRRENTMLFAILLKLFLGAPINGIKIAVITPFINGRFGTKRSFITS